MQAMRSIFSASFRGLGRSGNVWEGPYILGNVFRKGGSIQNIQEILPFGKPKYRILCVELWIQRWHCENLRKETV